MDVKTMVIYCPLSGTAKKVSEVVSSADGTCLAVGAMLFIVSDEEIPEPQKEL